MCVLNDFVYKNWNDGFVFKLIVNSLVIKVEILFDLMFFVYVNFFWMFV